MFVLILLAMIILFSQSSEAGVFNVPDGPLVVDGSTTYILPTNEDHTSVTVRDSASLVIPLGCTLSCEYITLADYSTLEVNGGTVWVNSSSGAYIEGGCTAFIVTDGGYVLLLGKDDAWGPSDSWIDLNCTNFNISDGKILLVSKNNTWIETNCSDFYLIDGLIDIWGAGNGGDSYFKCKCTNLIITNSRMYINGGWGYADTSAPGPYDAWIPISKGGDVRFDATVDGILFIDNSTLDFEGGAGFDLPASTYSAANTWSSGNLEGYCAAGGNSSMCLILTSGDVAVVQCSEIRLSGGRGGRAANGADAGTGSAGMGGGYSSGGDVAGSVGTGGDCILNLSTYNEVKFEKTSFTLSGGDGGAGGDGGDRRRSGAAYGRGGGGGYSAGGGGGARDWDSGVYDYGFGGGGGGYSGGKGGTYNVNPVPGGAITDEVGSGGMASMLFNVGELLLSSTSIQAYGGNGGNAGSGGNFSGGGGYRGEGGDGTGMNGFTNGAMPGMVSGKVAHGGDSLVVINVEMPTILNSSIIANSGKGGDAGIGGNLVTTAGVDSVPAPVANGGNSSVSIISQDLFVGQGSVISIAGEGGDGHINDASSDGSSGGIGYTREPTSGIVTEYIPMSKPIQIVPENNSYGDGFLEWCDVVRSTTNGTLISYQLQINTSNDFNQPFIDTNTGLDTNYTYSPTDGQTYYWRIKAIYASPPGSTAGWSNVWRFTADVAAPERPLDIYSIPSVWTKNNLFTVSWTNQSEVSGIAGAYYKLESPPDSEDDFDAYVSGNNIDQISDISLPGEGQHTIYIWLIDCAGNCNYAHYNTTQLYLDMGIGTPAGVSVAPPDWTAVNSFSVVWSNPADLSGIVSAFYKLDQPPNTNLDYTGTASGVDIDQFSGISVVGDGAHPIYVWLGDNASNVVYTSYQSASLYYDSTPPSTPADPSWCEGSWTNQLSIEANWSSVMDVSGVIDYHLQVDVDSTDFSSGMIFDAYIGGTGCSYVLDQSDGIADGHTYYFRVQALNGAGLTSSWSSLSVGILVDVSIGTPLSLTVSPSDWINVNQFVINWTNPPDTSGISGAYYKLDSPPTGPADFDTFVGGADLAQITGITLPTDGIHTIYLWLNDYAGNSLYNCYNTTQLFLDTSIGSPLEISATPLIWSNMNSFEIAWSNPVDLSGIAGVYYKLDSPPEANLDYTGTKLGSNIEQLTGVSVGSDGIHTAYVWLKDNAGNINYTSNQTIILYYDGTSSPKPSNPKWAEGSIVTQLSIEANWSGVVDTSGIVDYHLQVDVDSTDFSSGLIFDGCTNSTECHFTLDQSSGVSDNQTYYFRVRALNGAGLPSQWSPVSGGILVDISIEKPLSIGAAPLDWTNINQFTVSWANPTDMSGIVGAYYKFDTPPIGGSDYDGFVSGENICQMTNLTPPTDGAHNLYVWLKDEAGNSDYTQYNVAQLYLDTSVGLASGISVIPPDWSTVNSFDIAWSNPGDLSGIVGAFYTFDSPPSSDLDYDGMQSAINIEQLNGISVSGVGEHTIYIWLMDDAGNVDFSLNRAINLYYDGTVPLAPLNSRWTEWIAVNHLSIEASWDGVEDISGVTHYHLQVDVDSTDFSSGLIFDSYLDGARGNCSLNQTNGISDGDIYYFRVRALNGAGLNGPWSSISDGIKTDVSIMRPLALTANPSSWTNTNYFTVIWQNPYDLSGISGAYYKLYDMPTSNSDYDGYVTGTDLTQINGITVSADGEHMVYVWLEDWVRNSDYTKYNVTKLYLDTIVSTPTNLVVSPSGWTTTNSFTISWSNLFDPSGIQGAYYKLYSPPTSDYDGIWVLGNNTTSIAGLSILGDGENHIYVWLKDGVGNVDHTSASSVSLYLDQGVSSPIDLSSPSGGRSSTPLFSIGWTNPNDPNGIYGAYYKVDAPPSSDTDGVLIAGYGLISIDDIQIDIPGKHRVYVWLQDGIGNVDHMRWRSVEVEYDITPPLTPSGLSAVPNYSTGREITVSWTPNTDEDLGGYILYYSTNNISFTQFPTIAPMESSYVHTELTDLSAYYYKLIAIDDLGNPSASTPTICAVPDVDTDGDGVPDQNDAFPANGDEWSDTDGDAIGDNNDSFPMDPSASLDTDGDGHPDGWNPDMDAEDSTTDLTLDVFPDDSSEWLDTDNDGVGDNSDVFPTDPKAFRDTDGDGVGDNSDAFPIDLAASVDTDGDGYPDEWNQGKNEEDSTTGLELDDFPTVRTLHSMGRVIVIALIVVLISVGMWMFVRYCRRNEIMLLPRRFRQN